MRNFALLLCALVTFSGVQAHSTGVSVGSFNLQSRALPGSQLFLAKHTLSLRGGNEEEGTEGAAPETDAEKQGFDLDGWKRLYSNSPDTNTILPEFWSKFDKEGWSLWFCEYKYSSDYTKKLQASNLIGGWFQRLDATGARKVAFGNVHVFGTEPNLELAGCWLIKGQNIPAEFTEVVDHEQWEFTKVDPDDEAQRQAVSDFWRWEGSFGKGRVLASGKTYK